jgi:hypothetical protein
MSIEYKMSVAAHLLEVGKTYKLGNGQPFKVGSVDVEAKAPLPNGTQRFYYYTQDGREVVTKAGEMYTEMPTPPPSLSLNPGGQTYGQGGRRRKSRKARRAQKKRTRRSRR